MLHVSLTCLLSEHFHHRTVTSERCFMEMPPSVAVAVRAMLPSYPCECTEKCSFPQRTFARRFVQKRKSRAGVQQNGATRNIL
jgi:hypothetical protein